MPGPCEGSSTRDLEQCASQRLREVRAELKSYLEESKRLIEQDEMDHAALVESQAAWERFVKVDCEAAYEHSSPGSMRSLQMIECEVHHTTNRTYELWSRYLAGTVTELPEPESRCSLDLGSR
jgi:uncharacterized protein YecT (DUF1311 family)